ncbi:MAG: hypothetical protein KDK66_02795 [Deltaproteobacteria bacterium]|nr:hypothetical protein [Deltaproteobacteria bacterium]
MKIKLPLFFSILGLLSLFTLGACSHPTSDFYKKAESFIQTYYLKADAKGSLKITEGPAAQKIKQELDLLEGLTPSQNPERPKMTYKIFACENPIEDQAHCDYQLDIQMDHQTRVRKGRLSLRKIDEVWWITQFVEAPYEDS